MQRRADPGAEGAWPPVAPAWLAGRGKIAGSWSSLIADRARPVLRSRTRRRRAMMARSGPMRPPPQGPREPHHRCSGVVPARLPAAGRSGRRRNVAVHAEQVVRVVVGLDALQALVVLPIGFGGLSMALLGPLEVHVVPTGGVRADPGPRSADPLPERIGIELARLPGAVHAPDEVGVPVPDRPIVLVVLVERTTEVQESQLPLRDGAVGEQAPHGRQQVIAQLGRVAGLPVVVLALRLGPVEVGLELDIGLLP